VARQLQGAALVARVAALNPDDDEEDQVPLQGPVQEATAAAVAPMVMDPGMWLSMANIKSPQLADLGIESTKNFILDYKRYSQKCPEQLCRRMQHFILEDNLERDEFIVMLEMHQANSSRKWRLMLKNAEMVMEDLSLSTYSQYVEDFKFWMKVAGDTHNIPDKEIIKIFVNGLKPEIYRDEMY
jgi:hypothetical protein